MCARSISARPLLVQRNSQPLHPSGLSPNSANLHTSLLHCHPSYARILQSVATLDGSNLNDTNQPPCLHYCEPAAEQVRSRSPTRSSRPSPPQPLRCTLPELSIRQSGHQVVCADTHFDQFPGNHSHPRIARKTLTFTRQKLMILVAVRMGVGGYSKDLPGRFTRCRPL